LVASSADVPHFASPLQGFQGLYASSLRPAVGGTNANEDSRGTGEKASGEARWVAELEEVHRCAGRRRAAVVEAIEAALGGHWRQQVRALAKQEERVLRTPQPAPTG
jgi:hypothetical protein